MRVMLKVKMDVEKANQAIKNGRMPQLIEGLVGQIKPEAAFFGVEDGYRCGYFVFDMTDTSTMPVIGEPLFMELGAAITLSPVMNAEELRKGLSMI